MDFPIPEYPVIKVYVDDFIRISTIYEYLSVS